MQWHPHFAKLLRPLLKGYFDIQINVPVGDAPREADLVLVRRIASGKLPFRGLWKHLTPWNVFEYKGPTVSARIGDLDLLVELERFTVGLHVDRISVTSWGIATPKEVEDATHFY